MPGLLIAQTFGLPASIKSNVFFLVYPCVTEEDGEKKNTEPGDAPANKKEQNAEAEKPAESDEAKTQESEAGGEKTEEGEKAPDGERTEEGETEKTEDASEEQKSSEDTTKET